MEDKPMFRCVGYWSLDRRCRDGFIHPSYLSKNNLSLKEKSLVLGYLRSGLVVDECLGYSFCRMPDGPPDNEMGCRDFSDGFYVWPEGLSVYVDRYDIELPEEFVAQMRKNDFRIPPGIELEDLKKRMEFEGSDFSFWRKWCSKRIPARPWWKFWA